MNMPIQPKAIDATQTCEVCGPSSKPKFLYSKRGCDIYQCSDCSLGWTHLREQINFEDVYNETYFNGAQDDGYADYAGSEQVLRDEFRRVLGCIRHHVGPGRKRLLEIGSAHGFFLLEAEKEFDCTGLEFSASAAQEARKRGLNVIQGGASRETLADLGEFDVIVLLDTIEHLPNPREVIEACAHHLNAGGILIFTTGDFGSPYAKASGIKWRLMTPPQHLFFFTEGSVRKLARLAGLDVIRFDHPWKFVPLNLILYQLPRILGFKNFRPFEKFAGSSFGVPVNLFDAMRVVYRKD